MSVQRKSHSLPFDLLLEGQAQLGMDEGTLPSVIDRALGDIAHLFPRGVGGYFLEQALD